MATKCEICGKGVSTGSRIVRHGLAKKKGGIGLHTTAVTRRWFKPNIQKVRAIIDGRVCRIRVSAKAIRMGLIVKPVKRDWQPATTEAPV